MAISEPTEPSAGTSAPTVQLNRTQVRSRPIQKAHTPPAQPITLTNQAVGHQPPREAPPLTA
jgi:hypothetical protein